MRRIGSKQPSYADSATLKVATSFHESSSGSFVGHRSTAESLLEGEAPQDREVPQDGLSVRGLARLAYLMQYFSVGLIYGGLPATTYGFLLGYLNVPSYVYSSCGTILTLPWSFKFFMGALNDCVPICGLRRKPYMVFGWALCCAMLILLYLMPLPAPFYCVDEATGHFLIDQPPCNPAAAESGGGWPSFVRLPTACA